MTEPRPGNWERISDEKREVAQPTTPRVRRQVIAAVQVDDEIITTGGVFGTVVGLDDDTLDVRIADGVVVKLARGAIAQRILPDEPAADLDATETEDDDTE